MRWFFTKELFLRCFARASKLFEDLRVPLKMSTASSVISLNVGRSIGMINSDWSSQCEQFITMGNVPDPTIGDVPKDVVADLPMLIFEGKKVIVVDNSEDIAGCVDLLRFEAQHVPILTQDGQGGFGSDTIQVVGFDTETKPKFSKGPERHKVALVQVATSETAVLFRLSSMETDTHMVPLFDLLADPGVIKDDNGSFIDVGRLFRQRFPSLQRLGLKPLAAAVLGMRLAKGQQMKNWAQAQDLTPPMMRYAAADAFVGLVLFNRFLTDSRPVGPVGKVDPTAAPPPFAAENGDALASEPTSTHPVPSTVPARDTGASHSTTRRGGDGYKHSGRDHGGRSRGRGAARGRRGRGGGRGGSGGRHTHAHTGDVNDGIGGGGGRGGRGGGRSRGQGPPRRGRARGRGHVHVSAVQH